MKLPSFLKRTEPRSFHYTPVFKKDDEMPVSKRLEDRADTKYQFTRKAQQRSIMPHGVVSLLIPALFLAAIAYFCLIIFGKL